MEPRSVCSGDQLTWGEEHSHCTQSSYQRRSIDRAPEAQYPVWAGLLLVLILFGLAFAGLARADVCRVTTTGNASNNGGSWSAPMDLQTALGASSCTEVWVAAGVYKPGTSETDSFGIQSGVAVYGGFAGHENQRSQRDPGANLTVLSGDIDGNDTVDAHGITRTADDITGGNSDHVVYLDGTGTPILGDTLGTDGGGNLDTDPKLGPLADNGGFTPTMLPGTGSSAIDTGTCSGAPATDQRGVARPQGNGCDVGAVEVVKVDLIFADGFES